MTEGLKLRRQLVMYGEKIETRFSFGSDPSKEFDSELTFIKRNSSVPRFFKVDWTLKPLALNEGIN